MIISHEHAPAEARSSTLRVTFSLAALLGVLTIACVLLGLWRSTRGYTVTAYLKVTLNRPAGSAGGHVSAKEIERRAVDSIALIKSSKVIGAALAKPGVAKLSAQLGGAKAAEQAINARLEASFPGDGEILDVRFEGRGDGAELDRQLLKAIVDAYLGEAKRQQLATPPGEPAVDVTIVQEPVIWRH